MDFETYLEGLRGKTAAVIGIGVSNRPLIELLLRRHVTVTARDRKSREALGSLADELAAMGCRFRLGEDYLQELTEDSRSPPGCAGDRRCRGPGEHPDLGDGGLL